jgi:hypothetical protein
MVSAAVASRAPGALEFHKLEGAPIREAKPQQGPVLVAQLLGPRQPLVELDVLPHPANHVTLSLAGPLRLFTQIVALTFGERRRHRREHLVSLLGLTSTDLLYTSTSFGSALRPSPSFSR